MTFTKLRMLVPLVGVTLLCGAGQPPQGKDPQSSYEPRSGPGVGQKFLQKFVGDWDVAKAFYPRTGGEPARAKGECQQTMVHGGRFLRSEFVFGQGDARTTGTGVIGFDTTTGKFTSTWIDSRATRMSLRQSRDPFKGEEIVLYSASLDDSGGREARPTKTVTRLQDDGRQILHRQYALGADGQERLMMELLLTRKAAPTSK
jgi:hypothetical protein